MEARRAAAALLLLYLAAVAGPCAAFKEEEFKVHLLGCCAFSQALIHCQRYLRHAMQAAMIGLAPASLRRPPCLQKCADSAFCTRLRGSTSEAFVIAPESVAVAGARATATVRNTQDANGTFSLVLTAYGDTLRLFIDEAPEKGRFQVPDVLVPGLEQREQVRALPCAGVGWPPAAWTTCRASCHFQYTSRSPAVVCTFVEQWLVLQCRGVGRGWECNWSM